jgi:hypothetical protein
VQEINAKGYAITNLTFVAGWTKNDANYVAVLSTGSGLTDQILVEGIDQGEPIFIAEFGMKSEPFADLLKEANAQGYAVTEFDGQRAILSRGSGLSEQVFVDNLTEKNISKFLKDAKSKGYAITGFATTLNNGIRAILSKGIKFQDQIIVNIGTDSQDFDKILNGKKYALTVFTFNINTLGYLVVLSQY